MKPERLLNFAAETATANKSIGWWENEPKDEALEEARRELKTRISTVLDSWFEYLDTHTADVETNTTTGANWIARSYGGNEVGLRVGDSVVWAEIKTVDDSTDSKERRSTLGHEKLTKRWIYLQSPAPAEYDIYATPGGHCTKQVLIGTHDVVCWDNPYAPDANLGVDSIDVLTAVFTDHLDPSEDPFFMARPLMLERWSPDNPVFSRGEELIGELFDTSNLPEPFLYPDPMDLIAGIHAALDEFEALLEQLQSV